MIGSINFFLISSHSESLVLNIKSRHLKISSLFPMFVQKGPLRSNFPGQPKYKERDMYGKSVYPFSFLSIRPMKCRYAYSIHNEDMSKMDTHLEAMHGWLGSMTVCCTPMVRFGKWQLDFHRPGAGDPEINIDQSKNILEVERGNDLLAALCIAYAFDNALCQPMVTIVGYAEKEHVDDDDDSLEDFDPSVVTGRSTREMVSQSYRSLHDRTYKSGMDEGYYDEYGGDGYADESYYDENSGQYDDGYGEYYDEKDGSHYDEEGDYTEENYEEPSSYRSR